MSKAERIRRLRMAAKNRIKRKFRSRVNKSKKGMRARGAGGKIIRKRFFVTTYDAAGRSLGTMWFRAPKPTQEAKDEHKRKYGIKHPLTLPAIDARKVALLKKKRAASKRSRNGRRLGRK